VSADDARDDGPEDGPEDGRENAPDDTPEGEGRGPAPVAFDRRMLELLVCPVTRGPLAYDAERSELVSVGAKLAYPIHGGIPVMLVDEARALD
jgi:uncharacterized protein YbaR (Trm112 family)